MRTPHPPDNDMFCLISVYVILTKIVILILPNTRNKPFNAFLISIIVKMAEIGSMVRIRPKKNILAM